MEREALGIAIGDQISTSYATGPYTIKTIWGAYWWWTAWDSNNKEISYDYLTIWPYPVASFSDGRSYINNVHQDGDRWFSDGGDEIYVVKAHVVQAYQTDMFTTLTKDNDDPRRKPYVFDPSVNYEDKYHVFHCYSCRKDFNGEHWNGGHTNPHCPYCKAWVAKSIIIMPKLVPGERGLSECVMGLNSHGDGRP